MDGHIILYNDYKYKNKQYNIEMFLESEDFKKFIKSLDDKYIIILGWDGKMLSAIQKYFTKNIPFLWINFWNKWFLLQDKSIILENNKYTNKKYSLFDVYIDWEKKSTFINEINISAMNGKMWNFEVKLWNKEKLQIKWDWLIIATPLGSTAYNNSLWWPILSHYSQSIVLTAKASWEPKHLPSIVLSEDEEIFIKNTWRHHGLEIFTDSIKVQENCNSVEIKINKSEYILQLAIAKNQEDIWENKIFEF